MEEAGHQLSPAQLHQLMSVIAGMESVKEAKGEPGTAGSPPPTDEEIQQFLDYVGCGVINTQRLEYEEEKQSAQAPEPPRRNKQACQYFWRRHYLSIIQEDEEEHNDNTTPGSSRQTSRPGSTYENNMARLSRVIGALSPVTVSSGDSNKEVRGSWGSEMSLESMTSINSILSEEGSVTSNGSFDSSDRSNCDLNNRDDKLQQHRTAPQNLSSLLESVHPPSNTPDSMLSQDSSSIRLSKAESEHEDSITPATSGAAATKFRMGSKFKQSIQQIEELKRKGKREFKELSEKVFSKDTSSPKTIHSSPSSVYCNSKGPSTLITTCDPPDSSQSITPLCYNNMSEREQEVKTLRYNSFSVYTQS